MEFLLNSFIVCNVMCWLLYACSHDEVIRLLDRIGFFIGFMTACITVGMVAVAVVLRRRGGLQGELDHLLDDARKRLQETKFGDR